LHRDTGNADNPSALPAFTLRPFIYAGVNRFPKGESDGETIFGMTTKGVGKM
jgi:hypothetical protein